MLLEVLLPDFKADFHFTQTESSIFSKVEMIGESKKCELVVFEVELKDGFQNRRVAITQEMFKLLRALRVNNALVSFVNTNQMNYRISLLTSRYEYKEGKIVRILSNPRRYSYSLGVGTKTKSSNNRRINSTM